MEPKVNNWEFCEKPEIIVHETDILLIGGGMACCGAAFEADRRATEQGLRITMVDKAATDRSGAVAQGLSAINSYPGRKLAHEEYPDGPCADTASLTRDSSPSTPDPPWNGSDAMEGRPVRVFPAKSRKPSSCFVGHSHASLFLHEKVVGWVRLLDTKIEEIFRILLNRRVW